MKIGRWRRAFRARSTAPSPMMGRELALLAAFDGAVGHGHRARAARGEVGGGQLDHLAGADEEDADLAQVLEQLGGQAHRGSSHADRVGADLGGGAHLLGHREGALEQLVQRGAQGAGGLGLAHRLLHLAQDLRLAQHHGVQAAGDAEGMPGGLRPLQHVGVLGQLRAAHAAGLRQPVDGRRQQLARRGAVQFGAVAGGDQGSLGRAAQPLAQLVQRGRELVEREREPPAQVQRGGVVVEAEGEDAHGRNYKIPSCFKHFVAFHGLDGHQESGGPACRRLTAVWSGHCTP
jgi:hypothetical protein